jgi:dihydroorotate dehydrogenase electron transfer subunit
MRLHSAIVTANIEVRASLHLIEMQAPLLAQAVRPGQYCMVRCCDSGSSDPLLRRPFFVHSLPPPGRERLNVLVYARGRGTNWLTRQRAGAELDVLGPLGHGWTVRPTVSALLLVSEGALIAPLTFLAQHASEQELAVTLVSQSGGDQDSYPPALLPSQVEYHIVPPATPAGASEDLQSVLGGYLAWADAAYLSVSHEMAAALYRRFERLRARNFAQGVLLRPLVCGSGACLTCAVEMHTGSKLICRDGPVFDLREMARAYFPSSNVISSISSI